MVAVMGVLCGYLVGTIWPNFMSASNPGPAFMALIAIVFSFAIAYIAQRGVNGSTSVNIAINVIQISALLVFSAGWASFGYLSHDKLAALPNTLILVTLASNFRTFLLYMLSCVICIVAYHEHPKFKVVRHFFIPVFGLAANLACMVFYLIGPFMGYGTKLEPLLALGIAAVWGLYGGIYFVRSSKAAGRTTLVTKEMRTATS